MVGDTYTVIVVRCDGSRFTAGVEVPSSKLNTVLSQYNNTNQYRSVFYTRN